jgi:acetyl-CoA carboxylase carboxyltransferase component
MWPNARISVMGGEQAASVLATVRRDGIEAKGGSWSAEEEVPRSSSRCSTSLPTSRILISPAPVSGTTA